MVLPQTNSCRHFRGVPTTLSTACPRSLPSPRRTGCSRAGHLAQPANAAPRGEAAEVGVEVSVAVLVPEAPRRPRVARPARCRYGLVIRVPDSRARQRTAYNTKNTTTRKTRKMR